MKLAELAQMMGLSRLGQDSDVHDNEVRGCYIGDMLSNVMAHAQAGDIWLTVQCHTNVVAVAVLLNLAAVVFVEGHMPQAGTIQRAHEEGVPLFSWPGSAYQLARKLSQAGIGSDNP